MFAVCACGPGATNNMWLALPQAAKVRPQHKNTGMKRFQPAIKGDTHDRRGGEVPQKSF